MTTGRPGNKLKIRTAFFSQTDHGKGSLCPANGFLQDHTTFIQYQIKTNPSMLQFLGNRLCARAVRFFRTGRYKINIFAGGKTFLHQLF